MLRYHPPVQTDRAGERALETQVIPRYAAGADDSQAEAADSVRAADTPAPAVPSDRRHLLHSALTLAAIMGLAVGMRALWTSYALTRPGFAVAISACYLVMLVTAVLALCVRSTAALVRIDVTVLVTAVALKAMALWPSVTGERAIVVDEGMLMDEATRALAAGRNPYLMSWPQIDPSLPTQLMNGGTAYDFGYPAFGIELGAALHRLTQSFTGITGVSCLALLATALIIFCVVPTPLRPLATLGILGIGTLTSYAANAYPSMIALPFLCLAVWRWPGIGQGGRLGRGGAVRAVALGLALATHQLGWFLAVFLVVGLAMIRRGELPLRATAGVLLRYAALAAVPFFLVNLPFLVHAPGAWLHGITEPLTQHAVPHGQGIMGVSYHLVGGSGALDFYGYASILLLLALLVAFAVQLPWLGRAAVVLPWLVFMVSTRSQDGYFLLTMPLWIVGFGTTTTADFAGAYRLGILDRLARSGSRGLRGRTVGALATVALFVPPALCVVVAVASRQPLELRVSGDVAAGQVIRSLTVQATNRSSRAITPHFAVTAGVTITRYWKVTAGPATIAPGSTAVYTLQPPTSSWKATETDFLRVVSDRPQTLSSLRL